MACRVLWHKIPKTTMTGLFVTKIGTAIMMA